MLLLFIIALLFSANTLFYLKTFVALSSYFVVALDGLIGVFHVFCYVWGLISPIVIIIALFAW